MGKTMGTAAPEEQLGEFIARFMPEIADRAHTVLGKMRRRLPGAIELVYDNSYALAIGFGPSERASEAIFSVVLYPRWVSLFFLRGVGLPDPEKLLQGNGKQVRHIVIDDPKLLDKPGVKKLMAEALKRAVKPLDPKLKRRVVIKAISTNQRPRRPE
jgi:Domain of unknown function (DU1801)